MESVLVELGEEESNVFPPEPSVTAMGNTVGLYYPGIAPPSQRIAMDMEKPGDLSYCQHRPRGASCHISPPLPFNQPILMITYPSWVDNHPKVLIGLVN